MKPAVVVRRIGPYHAARLAALAARGPVLALEVCREDETYAWELAEGGAFARATLFAHEREARDVRALAARLAAALDAFAPDVVAVPGWGDAAALLALDWARRRGVPAVLLSDSRAADAPRTAVAEALKRRVVAAAGAALVAGAAHADYLVRLGMARERIVLGYDVVDNAHFAAGAAAARADPLARDRLGLPERYLLALGRFVEKKNFSALLAAHAQWRRTAAEPLPLVLVGDGPLKGALAAAAGPDVVLRPFAAYAELPALYGLAEGFVVPSRTDQWGLVVNEAMAAGCPVLVSTGAGASELVADGRNGLLAAPDAAALAAGLARLAAADRAALAAAARAAIADWGPERFAAGLAAAAALAQGARCRPGLLSAAVITVLARRAA